MTLEDAPQQRALSWLPIVVVFQLVYVLSYVDRQLLSTVVGPIKRDLGLSDTQIGLLQGFAFSLILAFAGLLTARRIDRGNRVRVLSCCIVAWCLMTMACGFATNFYVLLAARSGLAIAEAAVPIAILSILGDRVPRAVMPTAGALIMTGPYVGGGLAWLVGGPLLAALERWKGVSLPLIGAFEPWRGVFWTIGAPGILLGIGISLAVREPERKHGVAPEGDEPSGTVWPYLRHHWRFLLPLMLFLSSLNIVNMTIYAWTPSFMIRTYQMDAAATSVLIGPLFILSGLLGCFFGAWLMAGRDPDRLVEHMVRRMVMLARLLALPLLLGPFASSMWVVLAGLGLGFFLLAAVMSSALMPIQLHAPGAIRGRITAMFAVCTAGLGGLGPLMTGAAADNLFPAPHDFGFAIVLTFAIALTIALIAGALAKRQGSVTEASLTVVQLGRAGRTRRSSIRLGA